MGKFKAICIKNIQSYTRHLNKDTIYICEYDKSVDTDFDEEKIFIFVDNSYVYCDLSVFNEHFKTLKELRKEKINKLDNL